MVGAAMLQLLPYFFAGQPLPLIFEQRKNVPLALGFLALLRNGEMKRKPLA
jgi:hypothetical protein